MMWLSNNFCRDDNELDSVVSGSKLTVRKYLTVFLSKFLRDSNLGSYETTTNLFQKCTTYSIPYLHVLNSLSTKCQ